MSDTNNPLKYHCFLFVYKGLKRLEKKGEMLKDKPTEKHLPLLLVKDSEQVLSAWYRCYQPTSKEVGSALIMQKFQSDFSVYSNYRSDTCCGPKWLPYHGTQVCLLFRVYWLLNSASSNCTSILPYKFRSPHLFFATSCFNPLHIKGYAVISHLWLCPPQLHPKKANWLFLCSHIIVLPRDSSK